jgi:hypothetical protein
MIIEKTPTDAPYKFLLSRTEKPKPFKIAATEVAVGYWENESAPKELVNPVAS